MPPSKNKGKARVGGKPSAKAKNRQIRKKKTTRNYPGRFNGAGTASVKAKNLQVDNKTTSSQKSKSHDDDDAGGTSRKEAQPGIWKQKPLDNFTPSELAELRLLNEVRCTCRGSDGLSSCPRTRLPISPISFDDIDDDMLDLDTMSVY